MYVSAVLKVESDVQYHLNSNICINKRVKLEGLLDQIFKAYPQKLVNVPISPKIHKDSLNQSLKFQQSLTKAQLDMGQEGRVFIRKSGTEPLLRVMVESIDTSLVEFWSLKLSEIASKEFN